MKSSKKYHEMSSEDLKKELAQLKSELFKLRFNGVTGGADNKINVREVKKNIARVKTILREKEMANA